MTREGKVLRIDVQKELGSLLMLRSNVAPLFKQFARSAVPRIVLDFSGVEFMSRSFADEYLAAKAASRKRIEERSTPFAVRRMLELVSKQLITASSRPRDYRQSYRDVRIGSLQITD
jgi:hypothetical protein